MHSKRAQTWSTDLMLAFIIFGIIVLVFYAILSNSDKNNVEKIQSDAEFIVAKAKTSDTQGQSGILIGLLENDKINNETLNKVIDLMIDDVPKDQNEETTIENAKLFYNSLKAQLNVDSNFCIYFSDKNNRLIILGDDNYQIAGIGDPTFFINKQYRCGVPIN